MLLFNYLDYYLTTRNPMQPFQVELIAPVAVRRAMNGTAYTYIKTPKRYRISFSLISLTDSEREDLFNFFNVTSPNSFNLTDHAGTVWAVQFVDSKLSFQENVSTEHVWSVTIQLEGSQNV